MPSPSISAATTAVDPAERHAKRLLREIGQPRWAIIYGQSLGGHIVVATLELAFMIIYESALSFLGLGVPPPLGMSQEAHAGCLSFELSHGLQRIVVNCGLPAANRETWRQVARATAAHSTVVFNDTSSCRFLESGT